MSDFNYHTVKANGVEHHVVIAGSGPPVICVHGFPEDWYSFRHQLRGLSGQFTVIAYDLRGIGKSQKPENVLPDCGHFPHEEKPNEVNVLLLKFFSPMLSR